MESFEQVAKLDPTALRTLFERGRPEQRVWAIWALALRTGGIVGVAGAARDPDPGVRRTIAVMLAAHGEYDMLLVLARRDPSRLVRESAMQIVTRLCVQGAIPEDIVLEAAREDPDVRPAIVAAIGRGAPRYLVELALRLLETGTATEQGDAFEALLRTETRDLCRSAIVWLEQLPDAQARDACARMVRAVGEYAFACELATAPRRLRELALEVIHAPSWPTVEQLVGDDIELLLAIVKKGRIAMPVAALAKAALDGHAGPLVERLTAGLSMIDAPTGDLLPLLPLLDRHYGEWIAALERDADVQPALPGDVDDNPEDYAHARAEAKKQLAKLRKQLRRLLDVRATPQKAK